MANWKSKLVIADLHTAFENKEITIQEVAKQIAIRLKQNKFRNDEELQFLIDEFESFAGDMETTVDDYDDILSQLYDFGDTNHRIWVECA